MTYMENLGKKLIFKHYSATAFLIDFYKLQKEHTPGWSYTVWSRHLSIKDPSLLRKICYGTRSISPSLEKKMSTYFSFTPKEEKHFHAIIGYAEFQKVYPEVAPKLIPTMDKEAYDTEFKEITTNQLPGMSQWWDYCLRCLCQEYPLKNNYEEIAQALAMPIGPDELRESAKRMLECGLMYEKDGYLHRTPGNTFVSTDTINQQELVPHCITQLDVAKFVLENLDAQKSFLGTTSYMLIMESKNFNEMINELTKATREVLGKFQNKSGDILIQHQTQSFPVGKLDRLKKIR